MLPPDSNVAMSHAPFSRSSLAPSVSVMLPSAVMADGSVTLSIWTPSSSYAATAAYVLPPDVNVAMPFAPSSSRVPSLLMLSAAVRLSVCVTDCANAYPGSSHANAASPDGGHASGTAAPPSPEGAPVQPPGCAARSPAVTTSASAAIARALPSLLSPRRP